MSRTGKHTLFTVTHPEKSPYGDGPTYRIPFDPLRCAEGRGPHPKFFDSFQEAKDWAEDTYCGGVEYVIHEVEFEAVKSTQFAASKNDP